jgi:beta-1,4-mannosyltransferase
MKNDITEKIDRPYLLVSSTSFTPDEDFDVILKAFDAIDGTLNRSIYIFITGKGPLKQKYEADFRNRKYKQISVFFVWLSYEEYAQLLGCADMGISVHYSSSGLDLPMKVVDMFGSGLPVFAYYFET